MMKNNNIPNIPAEKFRFVADNEKLHDQKFETKQVSYFRDAFNRFCKNKSSVTAAIIIISLVLYAIIVPIACETTYSRDLQNTLYLSYGKLLPKNQFFADMGWEFWDGADEQVIGESTYIAMQAIEAETGMPAIKRLISTSTDDSGKVTYNCRVDSYVNLGYSYVTLTQEQYDDLQAWQLEHGVQVIYPAVSDSKASDARIWYDANRKGVPKLDENGDFVNVYRTSGRDGDYNSLRVDGDPGKDDPTAADRYRYAHVTGTSESISYKCRVFMYTYFEYKFGFEPAFLMGTTALGQDMMTRLASAARFSLIFAVCVSVINLSIGAVIGAIEGYYGGAVDMVIERIIDILARVPFMVVASLFQLHLASKVGPVWSMLFAFVLTGWIGMAGTTRMQFYRYKGQEYVLAARVLGASDWRIMFRHIFPNALGTIITSSVLVIPGVIFSESSLTYLGIVNLDSSVMTSVGTMLANGRSFLSSHPHIILFPALFISLLEISFNLFGNGLRDAFNPSLRGADE